MFTCHCRLSTRMLLEFIVHIIEIRHIKHIDRRDEIILES